MALEIVQIITKEILVPNFYLRKRIRLVFPLIDVYVEEDFQAENKKNKNFATEADYLAFQSIKNFIYYLGSFKTFDNLMVLHQNQQTC